MALDAVVESVLATSKDKVAQIVSEADLEVARILNEARERAAEIKSRKESEVGHAIEAINPYSIPASATTTIFLNPPFYEYYNLCSNF